MHIDKSIEHDPNYILAHFFKASFELYYAFYQCEIGNEDRSSRYAMNFYTSLKKARELDAMDGKYDKYNATIDNELEDFVEDSELDCDHWNDLIQRAKKSYDTKDDRLKDFDDYIRKGKRPDMLADMLGRQAIGKISEGIFNFGTIIGLSWTNSFNENVKNPFHTISVSTKNVSLFTNYNGFGVGYNLIGIYEDDEFSYSTIDIRYENISLGISTSEMEWNMNAVIPKYSISYVSDNYFTRHMGFKVGLGYHDFPDDEEISEYYSDSDYEDVEFLNKISLNSQLKVLNVGDSKSGYALLITASILPGRYISTGIQIVGSLNVYRGR